MNTKKFIFFVKNCVFFLVLYCGIKKKSYICIVKQQQTTTTTKQERDKKMKTTTQHDNRINRDNNWGTFLEICKEYTGRDFSGGMMSWDELKTTSYRDRTKGLNTQVDCHLDFNTNTITITEK